MARINHVITYGIGVPGDIEHVILMELNIAVQASGIYLTLKDRDITAMTLEERHTAVTSQALGAGALINWGIGAPASVPLFILMGLRQADYSDTDGLLTLKDRTAIGTPTNIDIPRGWSI